MDDMTEPTYTKADIEAARAMALGEAARLADRLSENNKSRAYDFDDPSYHFDRSKAFDDIAEHIRALSPDAATILAERDRDMKAQGYREALEAHGIDAPNPYEGER